MQALGYLFRGTVLHPRRYGICRREMRSVSSGLTFQDDIDLSMPVTVIEMTWAEITPCQSRPS